MVPFENSHQAISTRGVAERILETLIPFNSSNQPPNPDEGVHIDNGTNDFINSEMIESDSVAESTPCPSPQHPNSASEPPSKFEDPDHLPKFDDTFTNNQKVDQVTSTLTFQNFSNTDYSQDLNHLLINTTVPQTADPSHPSDLSVRNFQVYLNKHVYGHPHVEQIRTSYLQRNSEILGNLDHAIKMIEEGERQLRGIGDGSKDGKEEIEMQSPDECEKESSRMKEMRRIKAQVSKVSARQRLKDLSDIPGERRGGCSYQSVPDSEMDSGAGRPRGSHGSCVELRNSGHEGCADINQEDLEVGSSEVEKEKWVERWTTEQTRFLNRGDCGMGNARYQTMQPQGRKQWKDTRNA